jgi:hypothetical protein
MIAAGALIVIETDTSPRSMPAEQRLHVVERVDRHALAPDLAEAERGVVGVVAHQRGHVERRRQAGLAVLEQVAEALVGLLARAEAGELAHRPQPPAVHRLVDAAREGVLAGQPDDIRKLLAEQDILGLPFPSEYGGTGTGTLMLNMAVEEIAKACVDVR